MNSFTTLLYHEIRDERDSGFSLEAADGYEDRLPPTLYVQTDEFRAQMEVLHSEGYHTLSLREILDFMEGKSDIPEKSIHLSFDDMYQSVLHSAYPVLRALGFTASGFVPGDWIFDTPAPFAQNRSRILSWPELESMTDVFEYAHHSSGLHRRDESGPLFLRADEELIRKDLSKYLNRLEYPRVFAYPYGLYNDACIRVLEKSSVQLAFTTEKGVNSHGTDNLKLRRTIVPPGTDVRAFLGLCNN